MTRLRQRFIVRGLAAFLAVFICGASANWGHAGDDDPDGNPVLVVHDHAAHRYGAAALHSSRPADHCSICHSLRLLRTMLAARGAGARVVVQSAPSGQFAAAVALASFVAARSSRGPPVLPA